MRSARSEAQCSIVILEVAAGVAAGDVPRVVVTGCRGAGLTSVAEALCGQSGAVLVSVALLLQQAVQDGALAEGEVEQCVAN